MIISNLTWLKYEVGTGSVKLNIFANFHNNIVIICLNTSIVLGYSFVIITSRQTDEERNLYQI